MFPQRCRQLGEQCSSGKFGYDNTLVNRRENGPGRNPSRWKWTDSIRCRRKYGLVLLGLKQTGSHWLGVMPWRVGSDKFLSVHLKCGMSGPPTRSEIANS